ncbi:MAG: D-threitol dehydrogenase [Bifidobacteriaceae bacterium]|jgi:NAD(P)-dependent dehydrogenase (short-subunit alcohol dehydrogenase family)|nr:D-threitol dehydrogenase [Bifidobacteriaceae bacterium]
MIEYRPVDPGFTLDGLTAVITGGAAGIGLATAEFFAAKGARLVLADLSPRVQEVAREIGPGHVGVAGDLTQAPARQAVLAAAEGAFGGVDLLVNSAGIVALGPAESLAQADWDATIAVNLTTSFLMAQLVGSYLINRRRGGAIVNIASQAGIVALDQHVAYAASKGGVIAMTKVLALEWGRHGVRVNAVSPTVVLTELGHKAWDGPRGDALKAEMPSGRFAEPDEVAAAIAFLCSPAAGMVTGHNLVIDGGYTIK